MIKRFTSSFNGETILISMASIVTVRPFEVTSNTPQAHRDTNAVVVVKMQSRHKDYATQETYTIDTSPIYVRETVEEIATWLE